jgi:predicted transcriptional regulator
MPKTNSVQKTPLHLRLTCEDWLENFRQLNRAELGVLYYIRCLDPYGDRELEVDSGKLATLLGIHRSTVSRALMSLKKKNLISMEITKTKVSSKAQNLKPTLLCMDAHHVHGRTSMRVDAQQMSADAQDKCMDAQDKCMDAQETYIRNAHAEKTSSDSDQTHTNAPPEPGAPPTQETVCVESKDSELKRESTAVNPCDEQPDKTSSLTTTVSSKTKDVAASRENSSRHQKNLDHSEPLPWETDKSPREFNTGFEEWMQRSLSHYPAYQGLTSGEMVTKVRKHISAGKYDEKRRDALEIEWAAYQDSMKPKPTSQPPVASSGDINKKPSPEEEATRLRNFRIKFLKSIPEGRVMFIPKWTAKAVQDKELALSDIPQWIQESIQESMEF